MGRLGMGRRINGKRGRFALEQVIWNGSAIYDAADETLHLPEPLPQLSLEPDRPADGAEILGIHLMTPLRFKRNGRLDDDLPFDQLVRLALRRASSLLAAYGAGEPAIDYRGLLQRAGAVRTVSANLAWQDWSRYSNRQKQRMQLGGLTGAVKYEGDFGDFMALLDFAAKAHLGKNSSFGLGLIQQKRGTKEQNKPI